MLLGGCGKVQCDDIEVLGKVDAQAEASPSLQLLRAGRNL